MNFRHKLFSAFHVCSLLQIAMVVFCENSAFALVNRQVSFPDYYYISTQPQALMATSDLSPVKTFSAAFGNVSTNAVAAFNLMKWEKAGKTLPDPNEPYDRDKHFGGWIDDSRDNNCLDTRGKILVRSSRVPVTYTNAQKCIVATGEWLDPYTNRVFRKASDIQIDHFVPLKQAYVTGAWTWNRKTRCLFGNYLFNEIQLLAVSGAENLKKSDNAPDEYMPANKQIWCGYLANWLKVKFIWNLVMTPPEAEGIAKLASALKCNANDFQMTAAELQRQRSTITANALYCDYAAPHQPE